MTHCKYCLLVFLCFLMASCGSFGEGFLAALGGYGQGVYYPSTYSSGGNMDYLLDPNYAIAQAMAQQNQLNQVHAAIATQSTNQVLQEEDQQYQEYCRYNKKADGSNYSKDEWRAMMGAARQKASGSSQSSRPQNNSNTSSNSSSIKRCKKIGSNDVAHCNGTGICQQCNGNKKYYDTTLGLARWVDPCVICRGSGKCPSCNGKGSR